MKQKIKRLTALVCAVAMMAALCLALRPVDTAYGASLNDQLAETRAKKQEIQQQLDQIKSDKAKALEQKELLDQQAAVIAQQIDLLELQIKDTQDRITENEAQEEQQYQLFCRQVRQAEERGTVALCARRGQGDLLRFVAREAEKAGCALPRQAAQKLLEYAGQDLTTLQNEVEKLCAYALGQGQGEITLAMIEELVAKSTETTVFLLSGALVAGNYEKAYTLLDALFYQREEPIAILGALATSYVDMVRVRAALENGGTYGDAAQYGDYKGKDFRLKKAQQNVRGVPQQVLRESLHLLLEADMALKGSRLEPRIILDELIAKLLLAARRERA